ncbi:MAG: hypothetical protein BMS9Abin34_302 [Patescibacteria group bacterium]|nr:MAG: hypothetical protein BMS9Abin34_302 [Patescibacteria group bacterium]
MSLAEFATTTKRLITYSAIGVVLLLILMLVYRSAVKLYLTLNPPTAAPPTVGFGKLPAPRLISLPIEGNPAFLLETPTGELPAFADRIEVVAVNPIQPTLLGEEKARELARQLDFGGEGELSFDRKTLTFQDVVDQRTLIVNVVTQNFTLTTNLNRIAALPPGRTPSGPTAIKQAQSILNRLGLLKFGFDKGNQATTLRKVLAGEIQKAGSISEAQFAEVNFYRSLTEVGSQTLPILPPKPKTGLIQIWITTGLKPAILNTLTISYNAQGTKIDRTKIETYPLKNVSQAWEEVKGGKGATFIGVAGKINTVTITDVSLAYFDDLTRQNYLQPIFVFSGIAQNSNGEGEFTAYASAVSDEWVED